MDARCAGAHTTYHLCAPLSSSLALTATRSGPRSYRRSDKVSRMRRNNESDVSYHISGGKGGDGGSGRVTGGKGGKGEGPIVTQNIKAVTNLTNHITMQGQGLVEVLAKWLEFPPDSKDRQYELRSLHHEATGHWLLCDTQFTTWKLAPGCLWIKGISGTGKSVLSSTLIEDIIVNCPDSEQSAVAYFYFDFRNERRRMDIMLRSIIWQLSGQSPSPYSALQRLYKTLRDGTIQPQHTHLQRVLAELLADLDQAYIIIDGLDECDKMDWHCLIQFIHSLRPCVENAPHLLFTSQPLAEFQKAFEDLPSIELGSDESIRDITSFISSEVPQIENWASHDATRVTEQIVQKSNGMIRMAACLLIELRDCFWQPRWEETLRTLPADLFGIYDHFLNRAILKLPSVFVQAVLRWLLFSARELEPEALADAISFPVSDPKFDFSEPMKSSYDPGIRRGNSDGFKLLGGLIVVKVNDSAESFITLAHSSVKDYLLSPQFQLKFGTGIDLAEGVSHKFIAQTCVQYLLLFTDAKYVLTKDTLPDYPTSLYAAKYWFHHLRLCDARVQELFLPLNMRLLADGSSQHAALYQLRSTFDWDTPESPLAMCAELGYTEGAHFLISDTDSESLNKVTKYRGRTALHLALENGYLNIARLLVEHNASVNQATNDGVTALHLASEHGNLDIVRLLIDHNAALDEVGQDGMTALHLALERGHLHIVQLLVEHDASVSITGRGGWTALHLAAEEGSLDVVKLLMEHNASVDQATRYGMTALHIASKWGHLEVVRLLLQYNASVDQATTDGKTALSFALKWGRRHKIVELLSTGKGLTLRTARAQMNKAKAEAKAKRDAAVQQANLERELVSLPEMDKLTVSQIVAQLNAYSARGVPDILKKSNYRLKEDKLKALKAAYAWYHTNNPSLPIPVPVLASSPAVVEDWEAEEAKSLKWRSSLLLN